MARTKGSRARGRNAAAKATRSQAEVPDVYTDMLADTVSSPTHVNEEGKTIKRRRIAGRMVIQNNHQPMHGSPDQCLGIGNEKDADESIPQIKMVKDQTAYDESGDSAESDMNWEEVDFAHDFKGVDSQDEGDTNNGELNLVLGGDANRIQRELKRKPITAAERNMRLEVHKLYLLSLIKHVHSRNHWCNDEEVHVCPFLSLPCS